MFCAISNRLLQYTSVHVLKNLFFSVNSVASNVLHHCFSLLFLSYLEVQLESQLQNDVILRLCRESIRLCQQQSRIFSLVIEYLWRHVEKAISNEFKVASNVLRHCVRVTALQTWDLQNAILDSELQWSVIPSLYSFVHFNGNFVRTRAGLMAFQM